MAETKTVQDILDEMDGYTSEERVIWLGLLTGMLTKVSMQTLLETQPLAHTESNGSFAKFCYLQNIEIRSCVHLEISAGAFVREMEDLPPLHFYTEVKYEPGT